jgi:hypothetical protein
VISKSRMASDAQVYWGSLLVCPTYVPAHAYAAG